MNGNRYYGWVLLLCFACFARGARAWGPYAHQQIHLAAMDLIAPTPLGRWLRDNQEAVKRLSMTPDMDWQKFNWPPADRELAALKASADPLEWSTHFFDAEAFVTRENQGRFPDGDSYEAAYPALVEAARRNSAFLSRRYPRGNWSHPS